MNSLLETPVTIYGREIKNRILFQPMEGCDAENGAVGELARRKYLRFAHAAPGIIWFEATAVTPEGRANPRQMFLNDSTKESFRSLISDIKRISFEEHGFSPVIIAQLTHSGRFSKPEGTPAPIVAYRNSLWEKGKLEQPYVIASDEYCAALPEKYARAAALASYAGFDGIDVKCCHGYLLDEFLSATQRPGRYGGSLENRTRLFFECIDSVKKSIPDNMFVTTRLNACDCFDYPFGFGVDEKNQIDLSETKIIIEQLRRRGIELINITLGNPYLIPHVNRPWNKGPEDGSVSLERIYEVTKSISQSFPDLKFAMSGLSYEGENAVSYASRIIRNSIASFAGFGRMTLAYPEFFRDSIEHGAPDPSKVCLKCGKCTELMRAGTVSGCAVRDSETYMPYYKKYVLK
ncbi:MAG: flavin oxidoreductase/NADH oxidase [Clostridiales bacterium]|nr:flavin oxidoreductase/NADH oxidase [Clostridiales bacterium]